MGPPPVSLFMTTIASQISLRQRQEYILRALQVKKIPYTTYDLASDPDAKRLWRRKAPTDKQQLPGFLVGGKFIGTYSEFEDAVEHDELSIFLRQNEEWKEDEDRPLPEAKVVGVPGAMTPLEMTPQRLKAKILAGNSPSPLRSQVKTVPVNKRTGELDIGEELSGYGLQGVKATEDELKALIEELGLGGDDAGDLVKGLSSISIPEKKVYPDGSSQVKEDKEENPFLAETSETKTVELAQPSNETQTTKVQEDAEKKKEEAEDKKEEPEEKKVEPEEKSDVKETAKDA